MQQFIHHTLSISTNFLNRIILSEGSIDLFIFQTITDTDTKNYE